MKTGFAVRLGLAGLSSALLATTAIAQDAEAPAATDLPELEVIQDTPAQRKVKKRAASATPLTKSAPTPSAAASVAATSAPASASAAAQPTTIPATGSAQVTDSTAPGAVSVVGQEHFDREGTGQIQRVLQNSVPGVILQDASGNPARNEVTYRGFDASPVGGRSQGLAVYQNGVRINEAFGDTVNWDTIPSNAIESISIVSNNPAFGLNAVGGAATITMRDGFSFQGAEIDLQIGSDGYKSAGGQYGASSGNAAIYVASEYIEEDGFRDFSFTDIRRFYGDIGLRGTFAEVSLSLTQASNTFGATAAAPVELLERDRSNTFTSPQEQDNETIMPMLRAKVQATNTLTFSGAAYYRRFKQRVIDGNVTEAEECDLGTEEVLCFDDDDVVATALRDLNGDIIEIDDLADEDEEDRIGSIERINVSSESWGVSLEAAERMRIFNRPNTFVVGMSYDKGVTRNETSSEVGIIGDKYVVEGTGVIVGGPNDIEPRNLDATNTYWGFYFQDTIDWTDQLTLTFGGRYNHATIKLEDNTGSFPGLNATNTYERFNPQVGANYKITPGVSIYGGYSESNRAPTPAELGCAEPDNPCLLETFLTDDPPLEQVVGRTGELGLRGKSYFNGGEFNWSAGLFRTLLEDDILVVPGNVAEVFFINGGDTLRQGVELAASYATPVWSVYGSYAYLDATLDACTAPDDEGECAFLREGDRLPGIPDHVFKAGFEYFVTSKWKIGADLYAETGRPFLRNAAAREQEFEDENGDEQDLEQVLRDQTDGYARVDVHTSYDVSDNIQLYGFAKNIFDIEYETNGTYFEAGEVSEVDEALGGNGFSITRPQTVSPGAPFQIYGGVKMKY